MGLVFLLFLDSKTETGRFMNRSLTHSFRGHKVQRCTTWLTGADRWQVYAEGVEVVYNFFNNLLLQKLTPQES